MWSTVHDWLGVRVGFVFRGFAFFCVCVGCYSKAYKYDPIDRALFSSEADAAALTAALEGR